MALNGNGPVRGSTYADPAFAKDAARATIRRRRCARAASPCPPSTTRRVPTTMFIEECQAAVLGMKAPQQAIGDAARRVRRCLEPV